MREKSTKAVSSSIKDLSLDEEKVYIGKGTFAVAVKMIGVHPERILDKRYFQLKMTQNYQKKLNDSQGFIEEGVDIPLKQ